MRVQLGLGTVGMTGTPIGTLANSLTQLVGRPVVDRTGLTSFYDLTLKWALDTSGNPAPFGLPAGVMPQAPPPPADPDAPNIFTAVQEQLGLKLEAGRGPVEVRRHRSPREADAGLALRDHRLLDPVASCAKLAVSSV